MSTTSVASPCISVCQMDSGTGWCTGCLRTLDEIASWGSMTEAQKQATWLALGRRRVHWRNLRREKAEGLSPDAGAP